jgi:hypothetical protein
VRADITIIKISQQYFRSSLSETYSRQNRRLVAGMRARSAVRRRIKERVIVHQERQKEVFNILFTIFTTVYTILLTFTQASIKFIRVIAIGPTKGILGMLGPFYNNSEEGSRQPINLQSFPNLKDAVLDLTPATSRTNNLQQKEDKN